MFVHGRWMVTEIVSWCLDGYVHLSEGGERPVEAAVVVVTAVVAAVN